MAVSDAPAYGELVGSWAESSAAVYRPLADALAATRPWAGEWVLDVGSGTGFVADAVARAGGRVVAADASAAMVVSQRARRATVVADVRALPFGGRRFDAVVAGFVVNHVAPIDALGAMRGAVRSGGSVVASTWSGVNADDVKKAIDAVLVRRGWVPPPWYRVMKGDLLAVAGDPARLADAAEAAGLVDVDARVELVDVGVRDATVAAAYRLAMPQVAPWAGALPEAERRTLVAEATDAAQPYVAGWRPAMVVLTARR